MQRLIRHVKSQPVATVATKLVAGWALLTGLLIGAGEVVTHSSPINSLDRRITNFMVAHRTDALNHAMRIVTAAGTWIATLAVVLIVVALTLRRRLPAQVGIAVAVAFVGQSFAVNITKAVVRRHRPPEALHVVATRGWSFPSGHMSNAVVVFACLAVLVFLLVAQRAVRIAGVVAAVGAIALVGFSRIELGAHWTSDVVASGIWTTAWLLVVAITVGRLARSDSAA